MKLEQYELRFEPNLMSLEFVSKGSKGKIPKLIQFTETDFINIYNLSFGDKDPNTGKIDDLIITNNGDSRKVLNTIAYAVYIFLNKYPAAWIYAVGSSPARNRLYRIGLNNSLDDIVIDFELFGLKDNKWQKFEKNSDYTAFLLRRK
jgi:hypothetical protein